MGTAESEESAPEPMQWQVYIHQDMPEHFSEVLKQYEQFMNADVQNLSDDSVQDKLWGGEWKYLYDELCGAWMSRVKWDGEGGGADAIRYSLKDLTEDGFPELIMGYHSEADDRTTPCIIYYYSEKEGIQTEAASSYFTMTIYENNIVEYVSGGAYSTTTYLQFRKDTEEWVVADIIAVSDMWDPVNKKEDRLYYGGNTTGGGTLQDLISEEEYIQIKEKYTAELMEMEWMPLVLSDDP